jgi:hypothetical protein
MQLAEFHKYLDKTRQVLDGKDKKNPNTLVKATD